MSENNPELFLEMDKIVYSVTVKLIEQGLVQSKGAYLLKLLGYISYVTESPKLI